MASPESVVLITCSVPKGFTLCPAKLLAKLFLSLKYSCIDGISCDRDIGSDSSLGPTLMLYAF